MTWELAGRMTEEVLFPNRFGQWFLRNHFGFSSKHNT